jgi:ketosteroid isomerase-like protein
MTPDSASLTREPTEGVLRAFEAGETARAAAFWAEDGVFVDPHYPEPEYRTPAEIRGALDWAPEHVVEEPRLTVQTVWKDGERFAAEVDTNHRTQDGREVDFPQVFVVEGEDGAITRWQSYLPFPPPSD